MALADQGVKVHFFMYKDLRQQEFLCNNLGSRFFSCSLEAAHFFDAIDNFAKKKDITVKEYDENNLYNYLEIDEQKEEERKEMKERPPAAVFSPNSYSWFTGDYFKLYKPH